MLRIGASLDLGMVPNEAVESAIATVDKAGRLRGLVISGVTEERRRAMEARPDGLLVAPALRQLQHARARRRRVATYETLMRCI
ncbi:MAG: hypothetical protein F4145_03520 [Boseongicola sp. SB0675_bin_26]|nr:hypothetical protein [Boseongicola sp. SB0675_bin_26]